MADTKHKKEVEILVSDMVVVAELGLSEFGHSVISQHSRSWDSTELGGRYAI